VLYPNVASSLGNAKLFAQGAVSEFSGQYVYDNFIRNMRN
jgi:hypothetical protein